MIGVFSPHIGSEEVAAVTEALTRGEISGSFGEALTNFEKEFAKYCGVEHAVAVTSGTTALHLAVAAADIPSGSEILVSASTNIATALAAYHNGCVPVPVDSESETWNLNLDLLEASITPRTRAIIPVHLFGHPVDMDRVMQIADKHDLVVIEDCAESLGATCRGAQTGSVGHLGCFSFYANKVITTGEGGMVTTNDHSLADTLRLLRNLAFTEPRFRHERAGFNFRMTNYQAAMGRVQLRKVEDIINAKRMLAATYMDKLVDVHGIQLPGEAAWARNIYWMFAMVIERDFPLSRDALAKILRSKGVESRTFFCPMNQQPFLKEQKGYRPVSCPIADELWKRGMYLPSSVDLKTEQIDYIVGAIREASF